MQASRGKFDRFHRTPAGFTAVNLGGYGLCYHVLTRPLTSATYPVSVRQVAALLHASFRPHLAVTPLRFASTSPPPGCAGDSHPLAVEHARHTTQSARHLCMPGTHTIFTDTNIIIKNAPNGVRTRVSSLRG